MILTLHNGAYYNGLGEPVEVKSEDRLVKRYGAGDDSYEWLKAGSSELSKLELEEKHGTPDQFEAAVWRALEQGFVTTAEARAAIKKYREEFHAAPAW